ncbi:MAG TPA: hypothetical protein VM164_01915 [Burkholderiales bacterium]|nr:hypothetical protein [Burkholderiales bacterium]
MRSRPRDLALLAAVSLALQTALVHAASLDINNAEYLRFKTRAVNSQFRGALPVEFKWCAEEYDKLIASGVSPDTPVPDEKIAGQNHGDPPIIWSGTVRDIKEKWCDAGLKGKTEDIAKRHAPYLAALKNDKLRLVVDTRHGGITSYAMPGGQYTSDPKRLAAAPVWFLNVGAATNERQTCASGGKRNSVRRYSFDAQHKLLGTTTKEFCGDPPSSAYQ